MKRGVYELILTQNFILGTLFTIYDYILLGIFVTRYIVEITIVLLSIIHLFSNNSTSTDQERTPLLGSTSNSAQYGASSSATNDQSKAKKEPGAFDDFFVKMKKLLPFIWPRHDVKLQIYVVLCLVLMILGFVVNLLAPRQIGKIVDNLRQGQFSWLPILAYIGLKFLQGGVRCRKNLILMEKENRKKPFSEEVIY